MLTTYHEITTYLNNRYGSNWMKLFAQDSGYCYESVWRMAVKITAVTRRMVLEVEKVRRKQK